MSKKIKFHLWKDNPEFRLLANGRDYKSEESAGYSKDTSEHGRSKGTAYCVCCGEATQVYVWSFSGSGKRCSYCNVLLTYGAVFVRVDEVTPSFFENIKLIE